jgi:hypothetical protein
MQSNSAHPNRDRSQSGLNRRRFLGALGSGVILGSAGLLGVQSALAQRFVLREDKFGRMFPGLEPFFDRASDGLNAALLEIGKRGGILDAKDDLAAGPRPSSWTLPKRAQSQQPHAPAAPRSCGQFMDHDLTFDLTLGARRADEPEDSPNARTGSTLTGHGGGRKSPSLLGYQQSTISSRSKAVAVRGSPAHQQQHGDHRRSS